MYNFLKNMVLFSTNKTSIIISPLKKFNETRVFPYIIFLSKKLLHFIIICMHIISYWFILVSQRFGIYLFFSVNQTILFSRSNHGNAIFLMYIKVSLLSWQIYN